MSITPPSDKKPPTDAKPAAVAGGRRAVAILDWRPYRKNTLLGFARLLLPSGMILNDVMVHQRGDGRWISLPSREWADVAGAKHFAPIVEFDQRDTLEQFKRAVLIAFDEYVENT